MTLLLVSTVDILEAIRTHPRRGGASWWSASPPRPTTCSPTPREKLRRKGLDLIVLNDVSAPGVGMGASGENAITESSTRAAWCSPSNSSPKIDVARRLVALVGERLESRPRA